MSNNTERSGESLAPPSALDYISARDSIAKQGMLRALNEAGIPVDQASSLVEVGITEVLFAFDGIVHPIIKDTLQHTHLPHDIFVEKSKSS